MMRNWTMKRSYLREEMGMELKTDSVSDTVRYRKEFHMGLMLEHCMAVVRLMEMDSL